MNEIGNFSEAVSKIKGDITIEIQDVNTGETQVIKHHNAVTEFGKKYPKWLFLMMMETSLYGVDAFGKRGYGFIRRPSDSTDSFNYCHYMPWRFLNLSSNNTPVDPLADGFPPEFRQLYDPNNTTPIGQDIVGFADFNEKAYTGSSTIKGGFNPVETDYSKGKFKLVADFPTHAANGEINSISLTGQSLLFDEWADYYAHFSRIAFGYDSRDEYSDENNNQITWGTEAGSCYLPETKEYFYGVENAKIYRLDLSSPHKPKKLPEYSYSQWGGTTEYYDFTAITVDGAANILYAYDGREGNLVAIDISDRSNPAMIQQNSSFVNEINDFGLGGLDDDSNGSGSLFIDTENNKLYFITADRDAPAYGGTTNWYEVDPATLEVIGLAHQDANLNLFFGVQVGNFMYFKMSPNSQAVHPTYSDFHEQTSALIKYNVANRTYDVVTYSTGNYNAVFEIDDELLSNAGGWAMPKEFTQICFSRSLLPSPITKLNTQTMKVTYEITII